MIWQLWWVWAAAGLGLAILEVFAPGFIFLGFAIGAGGMAVLMLMGVGLTLPWALLIFALIALIAWVAMRKFFGLKGGSVKTFDEDINEG